MFKFQAISTPGQPQPGWRNASHPWPLSDWQATEGLPRISRRSKSDTDQPVEPLQKHGPIFLGDLAEILPAASAEEPEVAPHQAQHKEERPSHGVGGNSSWKMGKVTDVFPGADGLVRTAKVTVKTAEVPPPSKHRPVDPKDIKIKTSHYMRPITKLAPLLSSSIGDCDANMVAIRGEDVLASTHQP